MCIRDSRRTAAAAGAGGPARPVAPSPPPPIEYRRCGCPTTRRPRDTARAAGHRQPSLIAFGDASALVKLCADEAGAEQVRGLTGLVVGQISRVEVPAALWRKQRLGEITSAEAQVLVEEFEADFFGTPDEPPRFAVVTLSANVLDGAAQLCAVHGLRGYDAVQLSCALAVRRIDSACSTLAAFDRVLRVAAAMEGFALLPASSKPSRCDVRRERR